jgi:hypothetical protein
MTGIYPKHAAAICGPPAQRELERDLCLTDAAGSTEYRTTVRSELSPEGRQIRFPARERARVAVFRDKPWRFAGETLECIGDGPAEVGEKEREDREADRGHDALDDAAGADVNAEYVHTR